ncbi:MAG: hypothetical protein ACREBC_21420, partial [Pyrinomonadaceae bacterium]
PESCVAGSNPRSEALTGVRRQGIEPRNGAKFGMPTLFGKGEGNNQRTAPARDVGIPRGRRPQADTETICARTGRSCDYPDWYVWVASRSLRTYVDDERAQEVGQLRSTDEGCEQTDAFGQGGAAGGKAAGQRECGCVQQVPDSAPDTSCPWH